MRFLKVSAQKQRISRLQDVSYVRQELGSCGAIEVSDCASEKEHAEVVPGLAVGSDFEESVEILALEADDADGFDVTQFPLAHDEGGMRDFHGIVGGALAAAESLEQVTRLTSAAAAEFG